MQRNPTQIAPEGPTRPEKRQFFFARRAIARRAPGPTQSDAGLVGGSILSTPLVDL